MKFNSTHKTASEIGVKITNSRQTRSQMNLNESARPRAAMGFAGVHLNNSLRYLGSG